MFSALPLRRAFALALLPLLVSCESVRERMPNFLQPYRPDVQQGNVVTKEMIDGLATGMTREQVRFLLGTPALVSVFHQNRWDYVYLLKRGTGSEVQSRRLTVFFKDNRLESFASDDMPPEALADNLILGRDPKAPPKPPPSAETALRSRDVDSRTEVEVVVPQSAIPQVGN
jgi:outer membrane protein assembly factor BamE